MQVVTIHAEKRPDTGKKATKAVRAEGKVPAIMYGANEVINFKTTSAALKPVVYTGDFKISEIEIEGKSYKTILKDIDFHPVTEDIVHVDFLRLVDGYPIIVEIPVRFKGESPGVKIGGKMIQSVRKVKVKCVPEKIVEELNIDISNVQLGEAVRVRDIQVPEGLQIMLDGAIPVAVVEIPRALRSAAAGKK